MEDENPQKQEQKSFQYRRFPAVPREVAGINPEKDIRVRILGRIIDKYDSMLVVDDGSGKADIIVEEGIENFNANDIVRVFCRVLPLESGYELRAEIIQNMNGLDMDLYKKINAN
jgi:hypothetical protein